MKFAVDPDTTNQVYAKYFDIFRAADELGLDIMFNEHHQTMSNLVPGMPLVMAIAARETKKARLLALGNPVCGSFRRSVTFSKISGSGGRTGALLVRHSRLRRTRHDNPPMGGPPLRRAPLVRG